MSEAMMILGASMAADKKPSPKAVDSVDPEVPVASFDMIFTKSQVDEGFAEQEVDLAEAITALSADEDDPTASDEEVAESTDVLEVAASSPEADVDISTDAAQEEAEGHALQYPTEIADTARDLTEPSRQTDKDVAASPDNPALTAVAASVQTQSSNAEVTAEQKKSEPVRSKSPDARRQLWEATSTPQETKGAVPANSNSEVLASMSMTASSVDVGVMADQVAEAFEHEGETKLGAVDDLKPKLYNDTAARVITPPPQTRVDVMSDAAPPSNFSSDLAPDIDIDGISHIARRDAPHVVATHTTPQVANMPRPEIVHYEVQKLGGHERVVLRLDPAELGRVTMHLSVTDQGVTAMVQAERPEVVDLMRRHADLLQQNLVDAGYEGAQLDFGDAPEREPPRLAEENGASFAALPPETEQIVVAQGTVSGRLDMRL
ncbi:flagellar hook-length control protein FliK [Paracoccaceae bacterium GXU_MW_L88]